MKVKRCADFSHENAPKLFGGRALPGPAGGAYSAPSGSLTEFKGRDKKGRGDRHMMDEGVTGKGGVVG